MKLLPTCIWIFTLLFNLPQLLQNVFGGKLLVTSKHKLILRSLQDRSVLRAEHTIDTEESTNYHTHIFSNSSVNRLFSSDDQRSANCPSSVSA